MTSSAFEPGRLRLARELSGLSQLELARRIDLTAPRSVNSRAGAANPSSATQARLAEVLEVPTRFLELPVQTVYEGFFRSLRRTAVAERRMARAVAHRSRCGHLDTAAGHWPSLAVPQIVVALDEDENNIEQVATAARSTKGVGPGPVPNMVDLLERHGVVLMRLPLTSADVDAFSLPFNRSSCGGSLLRRRSELDEAERVLLTELCRRSSELAMRRRLAQRFMVLVRERRGAQLEQWIADVQTTGPPELRGFSRNLHRDWLAVQAGFTVHWSSGRLRGISTGSN